MTITAEEMAPDFDFRFVWQTDDAEAQADAIGYWTRLGNLPHNASAEERAKELVCTVRDGTGRLVGLVTGRMGLIDQVRARLAFLRGSIEPEHRRGRVGFALMLFTRAAMERWSAEHPEEKLAGFGGFMEAEELKERGRQPYWPMTRFGLIGYLPDGRQIRVGWFRDFRLDI
ncbi:MAG TPA: hypothetical protein VMG08_10910 [Allosphingosinicella sp.]|nr:hypothetical protein [Allosphingosinicella sp.]